MGQGPLWKGSFWLLCGQQTVRKHGLKMGVGCERVSLWVRDGGVCPQGELWSRRQEVLEFWAHWQLTGLLMDWTWNAR